MPVRHFPRHYSREPRRGLKYHALGGPRAGIIGNGNLYAGCSVPFMDIRSLGGTGSSTVKPTLCRLASRLFQIGPPRFGAPSGSCSWWCTWMISNSQACLKICSWLRRESQRVFRWIPLRRWACLWVASMSPSRFRTQRISLKLYVAWFITLWVSYSRASSATSE